MKRKQGASPLPDIFSQARFFLVLSFLVHSMNNSNLYRGNMQAKELAVRRIRERGE